ncbi:MAG: Enoyl-CoA hydratase [uncultured Rubrobacteraceae bacterium]|uniref:Enoyl-CoA hydratase n=1 Tax=uncultured Rubrobacteraceae bacterium TaxID=349277 RepID=A0A6J4Q8N6_9ACTN|nr:MAG: Enoyl-CoA hydratase [uncultured Rubrobacteraceae bacterium]
MAELEYEVENDVGTILLNRPEKKNAFNLETLHRWDEALREVRTDDSVGAVVLTEAGDAFCAGATSRVSRRTPRASRRRTTARRSSRITSTGSPTPSKTWTSRSSPRSTGSPVGSGLNFALMCDVRFAARTARMSGGYIKVRLVPGDGGCYWLPRLVRTAKALELRLTGDFVDAGEAHRIGLVNRVYEDEDLVQETKAFAEKLAAGPPRITRMIKHAVYQSARSDLRASLGLISSHMGIVQSVEESHETFNAFRGKRAPNF